MATRVSHDVTLAHAEALRVRDLLTDYCAQQVAHAHKTRSEAVRTVCTMTADHARTLAGRIGERLFTWIDSSPCPACEGDSADDTSVGDCLVCGGRGVVLARG